MEKACILSECERELDILQQTFLLNPECSEPLCVKVTNALLNRGDERSDVRRADHSTIAFFTLTAFTEMESDLPGNVGDYCSHAFAV
jgi:hypothetical protein